MVNRHFIRKTMVDRISTLPDEVLCHILSFLPTEISASTSILSKRWTPLWLSVPTLYFDDETYLLNYRPYHCFRNFINLTIHARNLHLPITTFRLQCQDSSFDVSDHDLNIWVNAAMQRGGLANLHIQLPYSVAILRLKSCIFTCKTLVVLKLFGLEVGAFSFVDLPSLKTMHLNDVAFPEPQYLVKLLSGCPILEDMQLWRICHVDSNASNKNVKNLSKLVRADIYGIDLDIPLKAIRNVQLLRIDKYLNDIPVFLNLTHLELVWWCGMNWHLVLAMLKQCSMLQSFFLDMKTSSADFVWISPRFVPECLSSRLRECCITYYEGKESELHFVKYILRNARVLRTMAISTMCNPEFKVDKLEVLKELSLFPRSSPICELSFE